MVRCRKVGSSGPTHTRCGQCTSVADVGDGGPPGDEDDKKEPGKIVMEWGEIGKDSN